jgi:hypothetical protein
LSNQNRFYVAAEPSFGSVPAITAADRLAAIKLGIRRRSELRERRDKTGGRTYAGVAPGGRNRTEFNLQTYLLTNPSPGTAPPAAKLVQAAMGPRRCRLAVRPREPDRRQRRSPLAEAMA